MCYSVIWSTDDRDQNRDGPIDLTSNEELWLAKLGSWTEALAVYESKLKRNSHDFEAILGCMRCLGASGEWRKVLELADENWGAMSAVLSSGNEHVVDSIHPRSRRKAIRICAQAAWRLGRWDELEKFADQLVGGNNQLLASAPSKSAGTLAPTVDFDGGFYSAVLHVHRNEWDAAAEAIDAARKAMDQRLTALMAESYSRAYPSMVTAQTLAEMEEIVEFRKLEERARAGVNRHPANRPNASEARMRLLSVWRDRLAGCRLDAEVHSSILAVRSLVLGPDDEVESTLTLSELSRQAQRFKFAERVLLDPLEKMNANLNGPLFGIGLPESLRTVIDFSGITSGSFKAVIDRVVTGDLRGIVAGCGPNHEQWSSKLVAEAGGLHR
jgi:FKBP12-rapamycin complex-associated protein